MTRIYLDFNASTPIAPEVALVMRPMLEDAFGNPSSRHWAGAPARAAVERGRDQVARLLGSSSDEIVFTSGGSEANNAAIKGRFWARDLEWQGGYVGHVVTTAVEHPATLEACGFLKKRGANVTIVPVDGTGRVDPAAIERALTPRTVLVTVMHANNEVGTIQPIEEIASITRARGIVFHTDAAQSIGKIPTRVDDLGVDMLTVAGHKLYAPKGVGALYVRRGVLIEPLIHGGAHEAGRRAGTESALLAVALGAACELGQSWIDRSDEIRRLAERLWSGLEERFGKGVVRNGHPVHRLPNTLNVSFVGKRGSEVLAKLEGVAASSGSACHDGSMELSPVLKAMGVPPEIGMGAVRFSLGCSTTALEIDAVLDRLSVACMRGTH